MAILEVFTAAATFFLLAAILVFASSGLLSLTAKIMRFKDKSYLSALKVTALVGLVYFVLGMIISPDTVLGGESIIAQIIGLFLLKHYYKTSWGRTIGAWIVWTLLSIPVFIIVVMIWAFMIGPIFTELLGF